MAQATTQNGLSTDLRSHLNRKKKSTQRVPLVTGRNCIRTRIVRRTNGILQLLFVLQKNYLTVPHEQLRRTRSLRYTRWHRRTEGAIDGGLDWFMIIERLSFFRPLLKTISPSIRCG